ncbi:MAG: helix-turn-helix domain-containing protein [Clostridiales bacterium]|nr:helix-turn-helix domain-containing protein [Clostridiales bacterium]
MKKREKELGESNIIGKKIESIRKAKNISQKDLVAKLQVYGLDIVPSTLSKIEGQTRKVTDIELLAFSKVLGVTAEELLSQSE